VGYLGLTLKNNVAASGRHCSHLIDQKLLRVPQSLLALRPSRTRFTMSSFISDRAALHERTLPAALRRSVQCLKLIGFQLGPGLRCRCPGASRSSWSQCGVGIVRVWAWAVFPVLIIHSPARD
jgi:hypothetical protein